MRLVTRTLGWQRRILAGVLVASALVFWRATYDVFNTTKATIVVVGLVAALAVGAYRLTRTRRLQLPATPVWWPIAVFVVGLVVATVVSPNPVLSIVGRAGRHTGLALYLAYVGLFALTLRLYRDASPVSLLRVLLVAAVPIVGYGLLQAVGVEPFGWRTIEGGPPVFSTFGNANFFSAWVGILMPVAAWASLTRTLRTGERVAASVLWVLALLVGLLSRSLQGPAVGVVGSLLVVAVWWWTRADLPSRRRSTVAALVVSALVTGAALLVAGVGPLDGLRDNLARSMQTRVPKWQTAVAMVADRPLTGVGLDNYVDWFHSYRSAELAADSGVRRTVDSPHNVVLEMFTNGGLLLGLAYLAVLVAVAAALVSGLRRTDGEQRLLLAGVGGAWIAYVGQALVSIDVPPLAALGWVLAGLVVALGTDVGLRAVALPGAPKVPATRPGRKRKKQQAPRVVATNPLLVGAVVIVAGALTFVAFWPLAADLAAGQARLAGQRSDHASAEAAYERAIRRGFWEARYPAQAGAFHTELGQPEEALAAHEEAARREPRGLAHALNVARVASQLERWEVADRWYERVLTIDPKTPEVLVEVGKHHLRRERHEQAVALFERAVQVEADDPQWWVALGQGRSANGDTAGAREAFQRALDLDPNATEAEEGLARLARR